MPNTEVKLLSAEDTYELPCWENRKSPVFLFFKKQKLVIFYINSIVIYVSTLQNTDNYAIFKYIKHIKSEVKAMKRNDNETRSKVIIDGQSVHIESTVRVVDGIEKKVFIDESVPYTGKPHKNGIQGNIPSPVVAVYDENPKCEPKYYNITIG